MIAELSNTKNIEVFFLQETHSTADNEVVWGMTRRGNFFLSHGTNLSAAVAILFSQHLTLTHIISCEVEEGRVQVVQAVIKISTHFVFINVYATNSSSDHVRLFHKLNDKLKQLNSLLCRCKKHGDREQLN